MREKVNTELNRGVEVMSVPISISLHLLTWLLRLPTDPEGSRKDLHDLLRVGDLRGIFLLGESDPGCGGHGIRGAEPGHHGRSSAEGGGVQGHA